MKHNRFALAAAAAVLLAASNMPAFGQRAPCVNVIHVAPGPTDIKVTSTGAGGCDVLDMFATAILLALEEARRTGVDHITVISTNEMIVVEHEMLKSANDSCTPGVRISGGCERRLPQKSDYIPIPTNGE